MGLLTRNDATLFRSYFKEMAKLRGINVLYQYPINMDFTMYAEETPQGFSEEIQMDVIFDENPKVSTLRKYGWTSGVDDSDKPYLASLPFDAKNLCKGCRITIIPPQPLASKNVFVITDIKADLDFPDCWKCKLAPVYFNKTTAKLSEYNDQNNVFMDIDDD